MTTKTQTRIRGLVGAVMTILGSLGWIAIARHFGWSIPTQAIVIFGWIFLWVIIDFAWKIATNDTSEDDPPRDQTRTP